MLPGAALAADTDSDGIRDTIDNCLDYPNVSQLDSDADGFGNQCDADFNQDGVVGGPDIALLRAQFGQTVPPAPGIFDINEDGNVTIVDRNFTAFFFGGPPGPIATPHVPAAPIGLALALAAGIAWAARRRLHGPTVTAIVGVLLLCAQGAEAGGTLSFVWTATTGSGTTGSNFIDTQPGDVLTAEVRIQPDAGGVAFAGVSILFDADLDDEFDLISATEPAFQFVDGAVVIPFVPGPQATVESTTSQGGEVRTCTQDAFSAATPPFATEFVVCSLQFEATGNGTGSDVDIEVGLFNSGVDSINDGANAVQTTLPSPVTGGNGTGP